MTAAPVQLVCLTALLAIVPACQTHDHREPVADHVSVFAHHRPPKPSDPVRLDFERFQVVKAAVTPAIEGSTATIEIDLASLHTGSAERDDDLRSSSYLDVASTPTAMITIDGVTHQSGDTYAADATVVTHGVTMKYPVTFDVLERDRDHIRIHGEHTFSRLDFGVGGDPSQDPTDKVGTDVRIEMVLTIPMSR